MGAANDTEKMMTNINVTPLVDVSLVLLITFMITTSTSVSSAIPLDPSSAAPSKAVQTILAVTLAADGAIQVDQKTLPGDDAVAPIAKEALAKDPQLSAVIGADEAVPHGRVIHMLDLLRQVGIGKINFRAQRPPPAPHR